MPRWPVCLLLPLALAARPASAASSDEEELELAYGDKASISVVTGTKQPLRRAPSVATVITAEDIAALGATNLDELLESVPGMHVSRSNVHYAPLYFIRGISGPFNPQTLMLQNGVPMTTLFVGDRGLGWGDLPLENVERIEIIRGPGSALYGADAFAGVINIVTKTAADTPGTDIGLRAGSFGSADVWAQHGGEIGPFELAAYLRVGHTDGFRKIVSADAQTGLDAVFGTHASLAPGPVDVGFDAVDASLDLARGHWRARMGYKLRDEIGTGAGVAAALDPVGKARTERIAADLSLSDIELGGGWKVGAVASYLHFTQSTRMILQLFPPGAFGGSFPNGMFGTPLTWERQLRLSASATYEGLESHRLRLGVGHDDLNLYRTQEFKNFFVITQGPLTGLPAPTPNAEIVEFPVDQSFLTPHRRKLNYVYVQDEWSIAKDWTLTAGLRHDHFSDFGGTTNPRLGLVWEASLDLTAKLLYGQTFRAPAFNELYSINNPVARGNPNLKPETIATLEAALAWQAASGTQLNLSVFRYRVKNIIRTVPDTVASAAASFANTGTQRGHGLEAEVIWDALRNLRVSGHYAYQRSVDEASGHDAGYAPHHHLYARADWRIAGGWLVSGQLNHVADRKRTAGDLRPDVPDYTTVDLSLRTQRGRGHWDFVATAHNLFDANVLEPSLAPGSIPNDLPMAPRALVLQAIYAF